MASLNKVLLIGNLTRDPEIRNTPQGSAVADLRLAVSRKFKTADGQLKDETCFVSVTAWGRQAETAKQYLNKGSPIFVEGRLKYDEWEKNGQKQNRITVVAERIQFLGSPRQRPGQAGAPGAGDDQQPEAAVPEVGMREEAPSEKTEGDGDNLPF